MPDDTGMYGCRGWNAYGSVNTTGYVLVNNGNSTDCLPKYNTLTSSLSSMVPSDWLNMSHDNAIA